MRVWIVTVGEVLPRAGEKDRLHRSGMLARTLRAQGHEVVWWGSTFDHFTKTHHYETDTELEVEPGFRMVLFKGSGYPRNISLSRIRDHREVAEKFEVAIEKEALRPDAIVASFPTIELSAASVRYGKRHGVPVFLDVRDLWPDIFVDIAPAALRGLVKLPLAPLFRQTREALEGCTGVIGISQGYLDWGLDYAQRPVRSADALLPLGYRAGGVAEDDKRAAAQSLRALGVDPRKTICWFVGTFGRTYDLAPVIETAKAFDREGRDDVQFVLSGSGEKAAAYRAQAAGSGNVVFTGWIDAAQIGALLSMAQVGLAAYAPGAPQGLPNKFFEYLSAGVPVLSSLEGEAAKLLAKEDCGLSYRAGDAADFRAKLEALLADADARHARGARGKALFDRGFSADTIYPRFVEHLASVCATQSAQN